MTTAKVRDKKWESTPVAHVKKDAGPACVQHALYLVARPVSQFVYTCTLW